MSSHHFGAHDLRASHRARRGVSIEGARGGAGLGDGVEARDRGGHATRRLESRLGDAGRVGGTTTKGRGRGQA